MAKDITGHDVNFILKNQIGFEDVQWDNYNIFWVGFKTLDFNKMAALVDLCRQHHFSFSIGPEAVITVTIY